MKKLTQEILCLQHEEPMTGSGYALQYTKINPAIEGNPVYIAKSGFAPENMISVLNEREDLRKKVKELEDITHRLNDDLTKERRENYIKSQVIKKKWYQFWK